MLQEDTASRCSSPNWDGLSATFEENPHDSTYQPSLDTSAASSSEPSPPRKFIVLRTACCNSPISAGRAIAQHNLHRRSSALLLW
ncbi:uncharacterized protein LOC144115294 isoform X2 [Amblyomma americanum]